MPDKKLVSSKQSVDNKFETRSDGSVIKTITTTTVEQYDDGSTSTETSIKVVTDKSKATSNQKAILSQKIPSTDVEAYKQVPEKQSSLFSRLVNFRNTDEQQSASKTALKDSGVKPLAPKNYISNPSGHDGFKGWKILSGESGWEIEKKPEGCDELPIPDQVYFGKNDKSCFVTSHYLSEKSYLVDFQKEGLPASAMASMLPLEIVCSQMYASRWDCGGSGRWHLTVLDGNKKILKEHEGKMEENHVGWKSIEKVFKFGTGDRKIVERIRYLEFTHEGRDLKCWAGNYGMKFARACVKVQSSKKAVGIQSPVPHKPISSEIELPFKAIERKPVLSNASKNLIDSSKKTPFIIRIGNNGLPLGTEITIAGCVLKSATRFDIDLCEAKDGRVSTFHFNPRFSPPHIGIDANVVVRNSCSLIGWGQEERSGPPFPFVKGKCFKIVIRCVRDYHEVSVNDKPFINFIHRVPFKNINFLRIGHDVEISSIEVTGQNRDSLRN